MSVSASWLSPGPSEHRRNRVSARARQRHEVKLALVPVAVPLSKARAIPVVAPADYANTHVVAAEPRRVSEIFILLSVAIALHGAVAWWLSQPATSSSVAPPQVPIEVVITKPPVIPPVTPKPAAPQPPKPVQKLQSPRPAPHIVDTPQADAVTLPPPPPVQAAPAPVAEKISEARADADYLQNPAPAYPALAQRQGWEGTVWFHILVRPDGTPGQIDLERSSGRKTLDDAALAAVKSWRFVPAKRGEVAVDGWVSVPIEFKLGK